MKIERDQFLALASGVAFFSIVATVLYYAGLIDPW